MAERGDGAGANGVDVQDRLDSMRDMAEDARQKADDFLARAKDAVVRYPTLSIAGAVAAGFVFAKLVRRK